jgi:hypothetical protein
MLGGTDNAQCCLGYRRVTGYPRLSAILTLLQASVARSLSTSPAFDKLSQGASPFCPKIWEKIRNAAIAVGRSIYSCESEMHLRLHSLWTLCLAMRAPQCQFARPTLPEQGDFPAENLLARENFTILDFFRIPSLPQNWVGCRQRFRHWNWQSPNWDARYERHPSMYTRQPALGYRQPLRLGEVLLRLAWL